MPTSNDYSPLFPNRFRQRQFLHRIALIVFSFTVILGVIFFISFYLNSKLNKPAILACQTNNYDYNILALRWTPTFCSHEKCINLTEDFDIHGLWPSYYKNESKGSEGPENCCKTWLFDRNELSTILPSLKEEWPNQIVGREEDSLWRHEWIKHGTCSTLARSGGMVNYFNVTLSLFREFPIQEWLTKANITPTEIEEDSAYNRSQIHEAIKARTGKKISIVCYKRPKPQPPLLDTIYLCFRNDSMEIIDCPFDRCKSSKIVFPKIRKS